MELTRRKWPTLEVGPLDTWRKRDIVEAFLKRSLGRRNGEPAPPVDDGEFPQVWQNTSATFLTGVDLVNDGGIGFAADATACAGQAGSGGTRRCPPVGLVLFPSMVESILSRCAFTLGIDVTK